MGVIPTSFPEMPKKFRIPVNLQKILFFRIRAFTEHIRKNNESYEPNEAIKHKLVECEICDLLT